MIRRRYVTAFLVCAILTAIPAAASAQLPVADSTLTYLQESYRFFDSPINPDWYLIRPGDQLRVTFIGAKISPMTFVVDPEGKIVDQSLGVTDLAGSTLSEARVRLGEVLRRSFTVDEIVIAVERPLRIAITVTGAVAEPGLYLGFTSQRVSEIIKMAGGIIPHGSRRNIRFESGSRSLEVDLDRARYLGQNEFDPPVYAGDHIYVPTKSESVVHVIGQVTRPRDIELRPGDNIQALLQLAGGVLPFGDTANIKVTTREGQTSEKSAEIQVGDVILVPESAARSGISVKLFGAVTKPGVYLIDTGESLETIIVKAGGHASNANRAMTTIFRLAFDERMQSIDNMRYALAALPGELDSFERTQLREGDSIFVPQKLDFVRVSGAVPSPAFVPFIEGNPAIYYIEACGGFMTDSDREWIRLYNRVAGLASLQSPQVVVRDGDEIEVRRREQFR